MNTAVNANVVHESEAQRQHARVKIPAKLRYLGANRETLEVKVEDLSAGGLSFHAKHPLAVGDVVRGRLQFVVDNLGLSMDIEFLVRSSDASSVDTSGASGARAPPSRAGAPMRGAKAMAPMAAAKATTAAPPGKKSGRGGRSSSRAAT